MNGLKVSAGQFSPLRSLGDLRRVGFFLQVITAPFPLTPLKSFPLLPPMPFLSLYVWGFSAWLPLSSIFHIFPWTSLVPRRDPLTRTFPRRYTIRRMTDSALPPFPSIPFRR